MKEEEAKVFMEEVWVERERWSSGWKRKGAWN